MGVIFSFVLPLIIGLTALVLVPRRAKPFVVFACCAHIASMSAVLAKFSDGQNTQVIATYAMVFFGLITVVIPLILRCSEEK